MSLQTPCEDFTVAALVEHLVGSVVSIGKALGVEINDDAGASPEVRVADASRHAGGIPGRPLKVAPVRSDYVLGLAGNTIAPGMRGHSFAEETLVEESAESLDRLVAFTGRQVSKA